MGRIAIIGGTGPEGVGLGLRFTLSGREVRLGSREAARARESDQTFGEDQNPLGRHLVVAEASGAHGEEPSVRYGFPVCFRHASVASSRLSISVSAAPSFSLRITR